MGADYKQVWHQCGGEIRRATEAVCLCGEQTRHAGAVLYTSLGTGKKDGTPQAEMEGSVCRSLWVEECGDTDESRAK